MSLSRTDLHQTITDRIVAALDAGPGPWRRPWQGGAATGRPRNIASGKPYNGINVLALWAEAQLQGYPHAVWGTYRQWAAASCQVQKGAKAALVAFYREITAGEDADSSAPGTDDGPKTRFVARATPVFNAAQVTGFDSAPATPVRDPAAPRPDLDAFVARTGAEVQHGGASAYYSVPRDAIQLPPPGAFTGSPTSTATESYYSTLFHELTHWTAPAHRCARDLTGRFGSAAYAMEELVAELGAAFLCADLGVTSAPRPDHAQYLADWLRVLRHDKRAIFTAASQASRAATFVQAGGASAQASNPSVCA